MVFKAAKAKAIDISSLARLGASVVDLAKYVEDEFAQVAQTLQGDDAATINYKAPSKPRTGQLVYADGTHWNPGNGEGFYQYTSGAVWVPAFVDVLSCVTSIAGNKGAFTLNNASGIINSTNDIQLEQASASQFGAVKVDGTTIIATSGILSLPMPVVKAAISWTWNGSTLTVVKSYNVASMTRSGVGVYTVNFTAAFADANYYVSVTTDGALGSAWGETNGKATGSCNIATVHVSSGAQTEFDAGGGYALFFE